MLQSNIFEWELKFSWIISYALFLYIMFQSSFKKKNNMQKTNKQTKQLWISYLEKEVNFPFPNIFWKSL